MAEYRIIVEAQLIDCFIEEEEGKLRNRASVYIRRYLNTEKEIDIVERKYATVFNSFEHCATELVRSEAVTRGYLKFCIEATGDDYVFITEKPKGLGYITKDGRKGTA